MEHTGDSIALPAAGTPVRLVAGTCCLDCRVQVSRGGELHLSVTPETRPPAALEEGAVVHLSTVCGGVRLENEGTIVGWVWAQPTLVLVQSAGAWRRRCRRGAGRAAHPRRAALEVSAGAEYRGLTRDVSASGASLLIHGAPGIDAGERATFGFLVPGSGWQRVPVRIARVKRWIRTGGSTLEVAVTVDEEAAGASERWLACLAELGIAR